MNEEINYVNNEAIGHRLREEREKLELTREKFAEIVDLSPLYIGQLERGERQMSLNVLVKISKVLHITTDYLIYGEIDTYGPNFFKEKLKDYYTEDNISNKSFDYNNLLGLLNKCSIKELKLIENMIKLIIPYLK